MILIKFKFRFYCLIVFNCLLMSAIIWNFMMCVLLFLTHVWTSIECTTWWIHTQLNEIRQKHYYNTDTQYTPSISNINKWHLLHALENYKLPNACTDTKLLSSCYSSDGVSCIYCTHKMHSNEFRTYYMFLDKYSQRLVEKKCS